MARQVKVMVSLDDEEAEKLDHFIESMGAGFVALGRAGSLRFLAIMHLNQWRIDHGCDSIKIVGSSDT